MSLDEYRAKREFGMTSEPSGTEEPLGPLPIFVVQEHHASHLHYDFRLEADGVLKSWAVPKGPSLDPAVKRLAVQVEDHPLGYATFEGTIPQGQYGGGTVKIWDHGTYAILAGQPQVTAALEAGRLEFAIHGQRLNGRFTLVRMKPRGKSKPQWLLIKGRDEFAVPTEGANKHPVKPKPVPNTSTSVVAAKSKPRAARAAKTTSTGKERPAPGEVELTHPDRVLFPDSGLTKKNLFDYYRKVADRLLPFLKNRPVTLERLPAGLTEGGPHFWQKNTPASYPDWIPRVELETAEGKPVNYALVNDAPSLLYLVNQGTLTFHPWLSRVADLNRPDFVLFDLDRGEATFRDVVAVAKGLKAMLDEEEVSSFVKTSGKTGLHIIAPWKRAGGFDEAREWALDIAHRVMETMPDRATVEIRKAKRGARVYLDVLQNAHGHHAVPPYVVRAVPGATVSTPLEWREVTDELDPAALTLKKVVPRLARQKADPFANLLEFLLGNARKKSVARPK